MIYCFLNYRSVHKEINKHSILSAGLETLSSAQSLLYKLYLYPLVLVISYMPVTLYRIFILSTHHHSFAFAFVSGFLVSLNGLMNASIYGLNKYVRQSLKAKCGMYDSSENFSLMSLESVDVSSGGL
jgi:hypothetical protein